MTNKRLSICVGINQYKNFPQNNLKYAVSDASEVHHELHDKTRGAFRSTLLVDQEATKENIFKLLKNTLWDPDLGIDDIFIFYFSGHGELDKGGNLYLIPYDVTALEVNPNEVDISTTLHLTDIEQLLENTNVGSVVIILDACHSGGSGKLLGNLRYRENSNIIFIGSARFSEEAYESEVTGKSRFTQAFLESFWQTPNLENWITLQQALAYVDQVMPNIAQEKPNQRLEITSHANDQNIKLIQNPRFSLDSIDFINEAKELYELSDARVNSTVEELPKNFFLVSQEITYSEPQTTLVGCFNNSVIEISEKEISTFEACRERLVEEEKISSATVITKNLISAELRKNFRKPINLLTLDQMISKLINFQRYLLSLQREYSEGNEDRPLQPPLKEVYVSLSGYMETSNGDSKRTDIDKVDLAIENWLMAENQPFSMILGGYGTGKTTVSRFISYKQAESFKSQNRSRVPIIFPLRMFPRYNAVEIDGFIVSYLRKFPGLKNLDFDAFDKMNRAGKLLLIFDGFDEMGTRVDRSILKRNFFAICSLIKSGDEKIIVSSRPEVFLTEAEQEEIFNPLKKKYEIDTFWLSPLSEVKFKEYVQKRVDRLRKFDDSLDTWESYYDQIANIKDLKEIATRPVILEITISTLPRLLEQDIKISKENLYEYYLKGEIDRQVVDKKRDFLLSIEQRMNLIQYVAMYLMAMDKIELSAEEIVGVIGANLSSDQRVDIESFC
jgi:hypothetical protein